MCFVRLAKRPNRHADDNLIDSKRLTNYTVHDVGQH